MSDSHFAKVPGINIPRSKFKQTFQHKTAIRHGQLVPIDCFEVIPGDSFSLNLASLIRMSTPIAPIMDNIEVYLHVYFCPLRLIYDHAENFYGANKTSAGPQSTIYTIPQRSIFGDGIFPYSLSNYLGKPLANIDMEKFNAGYGSCSFLKERGYYLIWNEWYRSESLQNPIIVNKDDRWVIGTENGNNIATSHGCLPVCKKFDYFTSATLSPQFGAAVTMPIGGKAEIYADFKALNPVTAGSAIETKTGLTAPGDKTKVLSRDSSNVSGDLYADLSTATAATINNIRYAFQLQKYLERSNFGGNRFFEILQVHYGVTSPDSRLQRPEYLGGAHFLINVNQVLSTADYSAGQTSKVGQTGAVSVTANKSHLFDKGFVEPGYVYVMLCTKQDQTYSQGFLREDLKTDRFEFYSPEFANLGDQSIKQKEIFVAGNSSDESIFGYQEHWAEYRYRPNRVSSILDPNSDDSLDYWTLANKFSNAPALDSTFIVENRDNIARALTTGTAGPDYICDFYFDYTAVREMPVYTIPGLIDHFGVM